MARTSPVHYIAPSAISITPNANNSSRDLAVYVAKDAKIKVYSPGITDLDIDKSTNTWQEWTFAGKNRRLNVGDGPYTIYVRLSKSDKTKGYLVFAAKVADGDNWKDKYAYVTWTGLATGTVNSDDDTYWWIKLGEVSVPESGQRTVTIDTGILGTDEFNMDWSLDPDGLPTRVVISCAVGGEEMGQTPYVRWGEDAVLSAVLVEGWVADANDRVSYWTITRNTGHEEADRAWSYPGSGSSSSGDEPSSARRMQDGRIVLSHLRGSGDDFDSSVTATFTVIAWGERVRPDEGSSSSSSSEEYLVSTETVPLATGIITVLAETSETLEIVPDTAVMSFDPHGGAYTPSEGIVLHIRATAQDGTVYVLTQEEIDAARLTVLCAPVGGEETELETSGGTATIPVTAFYRQQSVNVWLENVVGSVLSGKTIAFVRDGEDSRDREWIFYRSTTESYGTAPSEIAEGEVNPDGIADGHDTDSNQDGWVPNGWSDNETGTDETYRFEYGAYRDFIRSSDSSDSPSSGEGGCWGPFTTPHIWLRYTEDGKNAVRIDIDNQADIVSLDSNGKVRFQRTVVLHARINDGGTTPTTGVTKPATGMTPADLAIGACTPSVSDVADGVLTVTWVFNVGMAVAATSKNIILKYKDVAYTAVFSLGTTDADAAWQVVANPSEVSFYLDASDNELNPAQQTLKCGYTKQTGSGTESVAAATVTGDGQIVHNSVNSGIYLYYRTRGSGDWSSWAKYVTAGITVGSDTAVSDYEFCLSTATSATGEGGVSDGNIIDRQTVSVVKDGMNGNGLEGITRTYAISAYGTNYQGNEGNPPQDLQPYKASQWSASSPAVTDAKPYLWCREVIEYAYGSDQVRFYYVGRLGENGIDAKDAEWAYIRTMTNVAPVISGDGGSSPYSDHNGKTYTSDDHLPRVVARDDIQKDNSSPGSPSPAKPYECTDDPQGVTSTWRYEWEIKRTKGSATNGHRSWNAYSGTMSLHSSFSDSPVLCDVDEEMDSVACDSGGNAVSAYDKTINVRLWKGSQEQGTLTSLTASSSDSRVTATANVSAKTVRIQVAANALIPVTTTVTIQAAASGIAAQTVRFKLNGVRAGGKGQDAVIYSLVPSADEILRQKDGTFVPASDTRITCAVKKRVGGNGITDAPPDEYTLVYIRNNDGTERSYPTSPAGVPVSEITSNLVFILYDKSQPAKVVDRETIPLVRDGEDGEDAIDVRPNMLLRTVFEQGLDRIAQKWSFAAGSVRLDTSTDERYILGRQTIRISSRIDASSGANRIFIQSMLGKIKPDTWYTMSFYCFASRQFLFYINLVKNGDRTAIYDGNPIVDGVSTPPAGNVSHNNVSFDGSLAQTYHTVVFKTNNAIDSSVTELDVGFYMSYSEGIETQDLVLGCLKLEEGQGATYYLPNEEDLVGSPAYITVKGGCARSSASTYGGVTTYDGNALNTISSSDPEGAWINESDHSMGRRGARGLALVTIHKTTFAVGISKYYDTYSTYDYRDINCNALATAILNVSSDYFICLFSNDAVGWNDNLVNALKACGSNGVENTATGRYPFAFIGQKGLAQGYAFQAQGVLEDSVTPAVTAYVANGVLMTVRDGVDSVVYKLIAVKESATVSLDKTADLDLEYNIWKYEGDSAQKLTSIPGGYTVKYKAGDSGVEQALQISGDHASASLSDIQDPPVYYTVTLYYNETTVVDRRIVPVTPGQNVIFDIGEDAITSAVSSVTNVRNCFGFNRGAKTDINDLSNKTQLWPYGYGVAGLGNKRARVINLGFTADDKGSKWTVSFEVKAMSAPSSGNDKMKASLNGVLPTRINGATATSFSVGTQWTKIVALYNSSSSIDNYCGDGTYNGILDLEWVNSLSSYPQFALRNLCVYKGSMTNTPFTMAEEDLEYGGGLQPFEWSYASDFGVYDAEQLMGMTVRRMDRPLFSRRGSDSSDPWTGSNPTWTSSDGMKFKSPAIGHSGITRERVWFKTSSGNGSVTVKLTVSSESGYDLLAIGKIDTSLNDVSNVAGIKSSSLVSKYISGETNYSVTLTASASGMHFFDVVYAKDSSSSSGSDCGWYEVTATSGVYSDLCYRNSYTIKDKQPYTLSFWARGSIEGMVIKSYLYNSQYNLQAAASLENMTSSDGQWSTTITRQWKHYNVHWVPNLELVSGTASQKYIKNCLAVRVEGGAATGNKNNFSTLYVAGITFQEGWVDDGVGTISSSMSQIKQTSDEISATVKRIDDDYVTQTDLSVTSNAVEVSIKRDLEEKVGISLNGDEGSIELRAEITRILGDLVIDQATDGLTLKSADSQYFTQIKPTSIGTYDNFVSNSDGYAYENAIPLIGAYQSTGNQTYDFKAIFALGTLASGSNVSVTHDSSKRKFEYTDEVEEGGVVTNVTVVENGSYTEPTLIRMQLGTMSGGNFSGLGSASASSVSYTNNGSAFLVYLKVEGRVTFTQTKERNALRMTYPYVVARPFGTKTVVHYDGLSMKAGSNHFFLSATGVYARFGTFGLRVTSAGIQKWNNLAQRWDTASL